MFMLVHVSHRSLLYFKTSNSSPQVLRKAECIITHYQLYKRTKFSRWQHREHITVLQSRVSLLISDSYCWNNSVHTGQIQRCIDQLTTLSFVPFIGLNHYHIWFGLGKCSGVVTIRLHQDTFSIKEVVVWCISFQFFSSSIIRSRLIPCKR